MMTCYCYLITLVLSHLMGEVTTLYNTLGTWDKRCFIEDVPDNTMITYKWSMHLYNDRLDNYDPLPTPAARMYLTITKDKATPTDSGGIRRTQELRNGNGTVHFFAEDYGEYSICFELHPRASEKWEMTTGKLHITAERQYQDEEKEHIEDTQDSIISVLKKNLRKLKHIKMEQKYYREREHEFRAMSYLTSARVVWYGAVTALTVISTSCFMMYHMKSFFIKKKLV